MPQEQTIKAIEPVHEVEYEEAEIVHAICRRFFNRDGNSSCGRSICARFDFTNRGWSVSFYDALWKAQQSYEKITDIPAKFADLVAYAMQHANSLPEPKNLLRVETHKPKKA